MIVDKLAEIFTEVLDTPVPPAEFPREKIIEQLQLNSVDALEILIHVENIFDIEIDDDDLNSELVNSLFTLEEYVQRKLKQSQRGKVG